MKKILLVILVISATIAKAQKIDSIYINLYTDSLKKGTYNYINVDGLLSDGRYLPLDSSHIIFTASAGKFSGNNLWIEPDFKKEKISIQITCRQNPALHKEFDIYIKKKMDDEQLKTVDQLMKEMKENKKSKKNKRLTAR